MSELPDSNERDDLQRCLVADPRYAKILELAAKLSSG